MSLPESTPARKPRKPRIPGLVAAAAVCAAALAAALVPPPIVTVSEWAQQKRFVSAESGSPYPGPWQNDRTPHLVEMMDCMGFDHPSDEVIVVKCAQGGGSEAGINFVGSLVDTEPSPFLIVLPSNEEAAKYNKIKLQPTIEETPVLKAKIRDVNSRAEDSSTATFKRFRGGFGVITGANSSKGLQMISARVRVYEEVSEYPDDADGRGEPTAQAESRGKAWTGRGSKSIYISTPGLKGACRITAKLEASDNRRRYVPCPHCGSYQQLLWRNLKYDDPAPHKAYFKCMSGNGCVIEAHQKSEMLSRGVWLKTYELAGEAGVKNPKPPECFSAEELERWVQARGHKSASAGLQPGFHFWQAYSSFVPWDNTVAEYVNARKGGPLKLKVFTQQALAEPWEEKGEAPDDERLFERREKYPLRRLMPGVLFITAATDVQQDRLEWAVRGWDRDFSSYLIDVGIIPIDPQSPEAWKAHDELLARRYEDAWGRTWPVEAWGIDSSYLTNVVYRYARSHAASGRVFALDGRPGWKLPPIATPKNVDVDYGGKKMGEVQLWPVGTWDMKSELYAALRLTLAGPDDDGRWRPRAEHFPDKCDRNFFKQLTAEHIADRVTVGGYTVKEWKKDRSRANEQLDLAVYARALAHHLADHLSNADWDRLAAERLGRPQDAQLDLGAYWSPGMATAIAVAEANPPPAEAERRSAQTAEPQQQAATRDRSAGGVVLRGGGTITRG